MTILAVDPGDTTGLAWWSNDGDFLGMSQISLEDIPDEWQKIVDSTHSQIETVIVEDFILFGKRAVSQSGSRMKASQGIGMLKAISKMKGAEFVLQKASIKSVASKWSGVTVPSDHAESHRWDAYLHGYYYLVVNKIIRTQLEIEKGVTR